MVVTQEMFFSLIGGLGLFIFGMRTMGDGLQKAAGQRMRRLLEMLTSNPVLGVLLGAFVTAVIQSSSATTVMVVGFVNAGLMTLPQAVGVIMGANIGTTFTAQLIAFRLTEYSLPAIAVGAAAYLFSSRRWVKYLGQVALGFGLLFLGMELMKEGMEPLRHQPKFVQMMLDLGVHPLYGLAAGIGLTALVQSSSATIGILQGLAAQGLITLKAALPILFGDNIGTTVTALLASIGTGITARRAAVTHLVFNLVGTFVFLALAPVVTSIVLQSSVDPVRQIANAHTLFNVSNTLLQLPFVAAMVWLVKYLVPGQESALQPGPKYLERRLLATPDAALEQAGRETQRMAQLAEETLDDAVRAFSSRDMRLIREALDKERVINDLEKEITRYLVELSRRSLTDHQSNALNALLNQINDIERVGDHAENIAELAEIRIENNLPFTELAMGDFFQMYDRIMTIYRNACQAMNTGDKPLAREVMKQEDSIDAVEKDLRERHIRRLNGGVCYPESGVVFLDILSNFERIADHASSIAHILLEND